MEEANTRVVRLLAGSLFSLCLGIALMGCESTANGAAGRVAEAMKAGLASTFGDKEKLTQPQSVAIRLEASSDMNADQSGIGLATVIRVYQLRNSAAFLSLPHAAFLDVGHERDMLGNALIETREFTMLPGQSLVFKERIVDGASHLGVVALFRKRSGQRWRMAFASADAARSGIVIGLHACAMTATGAAPLGASMQDALLLSAAPCH